MGSNVTYLSSRSLAVYETTLIENFVQGQKHESVKLRLKVTMICIGFTCLAAMALFMPLFLEEFLGRLFF